MGFKLSAGGVFDGRHVYFVPYGETNHAVRYDLGKPFKDAASWESYDVRETNGLSTRGYDGAFYDGHYICYVPYYDGNDGFHGVMLRYDTRRPFTDPKSWAYADGGFTDGLKTVSFNGGATDGRYLYFATWMDGATFPKQIVGNGRILRYDAIGEPGDLLPALLRPGAQWRLVRCCSGAQLHYQYRSRAAQRPNQSSARHRSSPPDGVFDGKHLRLYVDGALVNEQEAEGNLVANQTSMTIGSICNGTDQFRGSIEGTKVSSSARTANWIRTQYNNLRDPNSFCHRGGVSVVW